MDVKVIYEMNPPKVLYNNYFDHDTINKNIDLFMSRAKKISEFVDGIHLTDNVLGVPRVSSLMLVSMLKRLGISKPISCTCRLYDKNLISIFQFVSEAIFCGVYSILILRGDEPIIGNKNFDIPPTKIVRILSSHSFNNYIKFDLSVPSKISDTVKIKKEITVQHRRPRLSEDDELQPYYREVLSELKSEISAARKQKLD